MSVYVWRTYSQKTTISIRFAWNYPARCLNKSRWCQNNGSVTSAFITKLFVDYARPCSKRTRTPHTEHIQSARPKWHQRWKDASAQLPINYVYLWFLLSLHYVLKCMYILHVLCSQWYSSIVFFLFLARVLLSLSVCVLCVWVNFIFVASLCLAYCFWLWLCGHCLHSGYFSFCLDYNNKYCNVMMMAFRCAPVTKCLADKKIYMQKKKTATSNDSK